MNTPLNSVEQAALDLEQSRPDLTAYIRANYLLPVEQRQSLKEFQDILNAPQIDQQEAIRARIKALRKSLP